MPSKDSSTNPKFNTVLFDFSYSFLKNKKIHYEIRVALIEFNVRDKTR